MAAAQHPAALHHLQGFITAPGETDVLFIVVAVIMIVSVLAAGVFFFWLHSLPERMVHNKIQFDIVAILVLLSLFTHVHAFWIAALLLAVVTIPDFSLPDFTSPLTRIADALEKLNSAGRLPADGAAAAERSEAPDQVKEEEPKNA